LRAGLFTVEELNEIPLIAAMIQRIDRLYPGLNDIRRGAELVRDLISYLIADVAAEAEARLARAKPRSSQDVRRQNGPLIAFSAEVAADEKA
ncbi:hypothetical protein ACKI1O_49465, partial [Streptomyces scabiei]